MPKSIVSYKMRSWTSRILRALMRGLETELDLRSLINLRKIIRLECLTLFQLDRWQVQRCRGHPSLVRLNRELLFAKLEMKFSVKLVIRLNQLFLLIKMMNGLSWLSLMKFFIMKRRRSSLTRKRIGKKQFRLIWIDR